MVEQVKGMTIDEFVRLYDQDGPFEFIEGERHPLSPTIAGHGSAASILFLALGNLEKANGLGRVFIETAFVLEDIPGWVKGSRVPDLMFYRAERLIAYEANMPDWKSKPFVLVPDLAVEIVSHTDRYSDVQDKAELYLLDGVKIVWILDPQRSRITIYSQNRKQQTILSAEDTLDGGEVIPGFKVAVVDIFA